MIFNKITVLALTIGIVCYDITAAMKPAQLFVPIFYLGSDINNTMSFDIHGLMNYPKPNDEINPQLYEKRFLSALNFNVEVLTQRDYNPNVIKCYISNLAAEIVRGKYDMEAERRGFIRPAIYLVEKEEDLCIPHAPQEDGFYNYPEPKNPFISHHHYTEKMMRILDKNITIAKQKGIDSNIVNYYKRRIISEITCMKYDLFIARYNQPPEYLFETF